MIVSLFKIKIPLEQIFNNNNNNNNNNNRTSHIVHELAFMIKYTK